MAFDLQSALQGYNNGGAAADLSTDFKALTPGLTTVQNGPSQGASFNPGSYGKVGAPSGGIAGFMGNIMHETGHLAGQAASFLGHMAVTAVEAPIQLGSGIGHGILDHMELGSISQQNQQLSGQMQTLQQNYKAGRISKQTYTSGINDLSQSFDSLDSQNRALQNRVSFDQKASTQALINTASDLVTLGAGFGKVAALDMNITGGKLTLQASEAKAATDWLASKAADAHLQPVSDFVNFVAGKSEVFSKVDATTQANLQRATAEVVSNAGGAMTANQIARATATNVMLKYPLTYSYIQPTASQVYHQLDQAKYGDAVRTIAFNAAMLLSGGPIGQALKYGGDALKGLSDRTFGQTSFWDELSKFYGTQESNGFANAIRAHAATLDAPAQKEFIRNLAAVEATNVAAVGGDARAAAFRVAKGMQGQYSFDLSKVTHEAAIQDMVNYAKNFRMADQAAKDAGLGNIVVGRLDARDKSVVADAVSGGPDAQSRLNAWEQWKTDNPNSAAANNMNFDKQVKELVMHSQDEGALRQGVMDIKAGTEVANFPESVSRQLAKDGYVAIRPSKIVAPFKEGGDKLLTAHTGVRGPEDFFTKAVQPVPVLSSVGALFTRMGLSPNAAEAQTYQLFNDSLARNLAERHAVGKMTANDLSIADGEIKTLSNYAHSQKMPVSDLRMLTTSQIKDALGTTAEDARNIQQAIAKSHLDVPLAVKGLGDRAVDWSYKLPVSSPIMRRYLKIQGALRFSFNPFFRYLRVIPKTEILSQAEGGGFISAIFRGRGSQIAQIRQDLHTGGFLKEVGALTDESGGIYEGIGSIKANLHKELLPMQERSIAGLVDAQAQRVGMDAQTYMKTYPNQVRDTVQMIAEYDRNANFLNSPLMRTLNIAFFPMRFDTKVATIFAKNLGQSSLITQVAVVNGMLKFHDFMSSPQGQAWYAQNSQVIGLINYITPLAHMSEVFNSLMPGQDHSMGNFGELGGLPFGWIPQLLDAEGLTHFNQPGMAAATGKMFPAYVPQSAKGQLAVAIQDLLGSLFSYPGASVGLPSKTQITSSFADKLVGTNSSDIKKTTPQPNAHQQAYAANIPGQMQNAAVKFSTGQPSNTQPTTLHMGTLPTPQPRYNTKNGKPAATKLKKSQFAPQLMPGQTQAGAL